MAGPGALLDGISDFVTILNEQWQVVLGNMPLRDFANAREGGNLLGPHPGEVLNCRKAENAPLVCDIGEACCTCGAINTILCARTRPGAQFGCIRGAVPS